MDCKLCVFDLDGTLTNTIDSIAYFANYALAEYGIPPMEAERYKLLVGDGAGMLIKRAVECQGGKGDVDVTGILRLYNEGYHANYLYKTTVYEGILELLSKLKKSGVRMAVLSNKPHDTTKKVVEALFEPNTFELVLGAREDRALKPNPEGVYEILNGLKVDKKECLYIGDTGIDMETGNAAGVFTVGVLWGFRDESELVNARARLIIHKPEELLQYIS